MNRWFLVEKIEQKKIAAEALPEIKQPRKYKVILINDDYTPMGFVVDVLKRFFNLNDEMATLIMLQVHLSSRAVCGVFSKDIAETKAALVNDYARYNQHPLLCLTEPE